MSSAGTPYTPPPQPFRKQRRPSASTSAAGISGYLRKRDICPLGVRSDVIADKTGKQEWHVIVTCMSSKQADEVWASLREGGYNLAGRYQSLVIVKERQT